MFLDWFRVSTFLCCLFYEALKMIVFLNCNFLIIYNLKYRHFFRIKDTYHLSVSIHYFQCWLRLRPNEITIYHNAEHGTQNTEQYNCHLFYVTRGLPGAFLGLSRGFRGNYLSNPPGNTQQGLIESPWYSGDIMDRR